MPIYEYRSDTTGCTYCKTGFDTLQKMSDGPIKNCPRCGTPVHRAITRFAACSIASSEESGVLDHRLKDFEAEGRWSHAAELADSAGLGERAMDNYKRAGYNF